jgi:hypothetical protein
MDGTLQYFFIKPQKVNGCGAFVLCSVRMCSAEFCESGDDILAPILLMRHRPRSRDKAVPDIDIHFGGPIISVMAEMVFIFYRNILVRRWNVMFTVSGKFEPGPPPQLDEWGL